MDARLGRILFVPVAVCIALVAQSAQGATYKTKNFTVTTESAEVAKKVGDAAEIYRRELAIDWLGRELPPWYAPCPIFVKVGTIGAGGATTFSFQPKAGAPAEVGSWDMKIQGSLERILDSVLPHEVCHTIFACYFRRPLPRWADEGAATLIEHESERRRQVDTVNQVLKTPRRIPLKKLFALKEYPTDMRDVMTLYAEGYSLAELLVQKGGKTRYLEFLNDANERGWDKAVKTHYGYRDVDELEKHWQEWVMAGSQPLKLPEGQRLAQNEKSPKAAAGNDGYVIRGQSESSRPSEIRDPFLSYSVAMIESPASPEKARPEAKSLPVSRDRRSGRNKPPADERHDAEQAGWAPDDSELADRSEPSRRSHETIDDEGWVDAPPAPPRPWADHDDNRSTVERSAPNKAARSRDARAKSNSLETERASAETLPSAVRQRQSAMTDSADRRDIASRTQRTPWSEFPDDARPCPLVLTSRGSKTNP